MKIEKVIIDCMQSIHNSYFIGEMKDYQTIKDKRKQDVLYNEYMLLRKMLVFYTNIPYEIKGYGDRLDIMYFDKDILNTELNLK